MSWSKPEGGPLYPLSIHYGDRKCLETGCSVGLVPGGKMMWKNSDVDVKSSTTDQERAGSMSEK